ncbi:MAG TPA: hypothetical protein VIV11_29150 [Kofleriaceae bacterium]
MRRLVVALCIAQASVAYGDATVTVTLNDEGRELAQRLGFSVPDFVAHTQAQIDELYKISRIDALLRSFANTAAFAQRGLGADYDVDPGDIFIGAGTAGVQGDVAIGTTDSALGGSIVNFSVLAGVNLSRWHLPKWTVFANGFYEGTTIRGLEGDLLTLGAHVQYQLVQPTLPAKARWTGVAITTGVEYAHWTVGTASSLETHFIAEGSGGRKSIHVSSTGALDVDASTFAFPIEVTTGARLLRVFSLYGGGGVTLATGGSQINAQLDSELTINEEMLPVGNATIDGTGENGPSAASAHAIAGAMLHTRHIRVFVQGTFASDELALALGLRVVP